MRILESERLLIKPVEEEDIETLLYYRWEQTTMAQSLHSPISMRQQREWYRSLSDSNMPFSVFVKTVLFPIGTCGLFDINYRHQRAIYHMRFGEKFQGQGYGTEAARMVIGYGFNTLNLRKVYADQFADNVKAVSFFKTLGGQIEGTLRKHYYHNGEFRDAILVSILKEEFKG